MEKVKVKRRLHGALTPAQARRVKKAQARIAEELPDLVRRNQLRHDARKEKTFSGALRRAIHRYPLSPMKIATRADIRWTHFAKFLTGEKTLPSDAIDRLVKVLKLKLPTSSPKQSANAAKAS